MFMQVDPGSNSDSISSDGTMTYQTAVRNTAIAVGAAMAFAAGIAAVMGLPKAMEFITGYVVEESLSVDNLFVFILLFEVFFSLTQMCITPVFHVMFGFLICS
jgi:tellurite resistance protein TerC